MEPQLQPAPEQQEPLEDDNAAGDEEDPGVDSPRDLKRESSASTLQDVMRNTAAGDFGMAYLGRELVVSEAKWEHFTGECPEGDTIRSMTFAKMLRKRFQAATRTGDTSFQQLHDSLEVDSLLPEDEDVMERSIFGLPVLHPSNRIASWGTTLVNVFDSTYTAFFLPISIAFGYQQWSWSWVATVDAVAAGVWPLDMLLQFHIGFLLRQNLKKQIIMKGTHVAEYYMRYNTFLFDLIATVALWIMVFFVAFGPNQSHEDRVGLDVVSALRLFRFVRVIRLVTSAFSATHKGALAQFLSGGPLAQALTFMNVLLVFGMLINFLGCLWFYTAAREGLQNSWLTQVGGTDLSGAAASTQYVASIYFTTTTITTTGYGDISAHSTVEQLIAIFIMMVGAIFFGFLIGFILEIIANSSVQAKRAQMFRAKIEGVQNWMKVRHLPRSIRQKIEWYYGEIWVRHAEVQDEAVFFDELPPQLRGEVARYLMRHVFAASEIFAILDDDAKAFLSTRLRPSTIAPGFDLCQEGDAADCLWLLQEGTVLALRHSSAHMNDYVEIQAPAVLGEAAILGRRFPQAKKRPCTFRALGSCAVWQLNISDIDPLLHIQPSLAEEFYEQFKANLVSSLDALPPEQQERVLQQQFPGAKCTEDVITFIENAARAPRTVRTLSNPSGVVQQGAAVPPLSPMPPLSPSFRGDVPRDSPPPPGLPSRSPPKPQRSYSDEVTRSVSLPPTNVSPRAPEEEIMNPMRLLHQAASTGALVPSPNHSRHNSGEVQRRSAGVRRDSRGDAAALAGRGRSGLGGDVHHSHVMHVVIHNAGDLGPNGVPPPGPPTGGRGGRAQVVHSSDLFLSNPLAQQYNSDIRQSQQ